MWAQLAWAFSCLLVFLGVAAACATLSLAIPGRFVFTAHGEKDDLLMSVAEANGADRYWFPNDQVTWIVADSLETLARILDQYTKRKIDQANIEPKSISWIGHDPSRTAQERRP